MSRKGLWGVAAFVAAVILVSYQIRKGSEPIGAGKPADPQTQRASSVQKFESKGAKETPEIAARPQEPTAPPPADPAFQQWIANEAKSIDIPNVDGQRKEAELRKILKSLTPTQAQQLLHTARNPVAPAGEKILSTYMMVLGGPGTRGELIDFLKDDSSPRGEPHTIDEVNGVRERSLRIMAIDGLVSQAKTDRSARDLLAREIPSIQDPYVKSYAQRKLDELDRSQQ
jgi:hypothetical protein